MQLVDADTRNQARSGASNSRGSYKCHRRIAPTAFRFIIGVDAPGFQLKPSSAESFLFSVRAASGGPSINPVPTGTPFITTSGVGVATAPGKRCGRLFLPSRAEPAASLTPPMSRCTAVRPIRPEAESIRPSGAPRAASTRRSTVSSMRADGRRGSSSAPATTQKSPTRRPLSMGCRLPSWLPTKAMTAIAFANGSASEGCGPTQNEGHHHQPDRWSKRQGRRGGFRHQRCVSQCDHAPSRQFLGPRWVTTQLHRLPFLIIPSL